MTFQARKMVFLNSMTFHDLPWLGGTLMYWNVIFWHLPWTCPHLPALRSFSVHSIKAVQCNLCSRWHHQNTRVSSVSLSVCKPGFSDARHKPQNFSGLRFWPGASVNRQPMWLEHWRHCVIVHAYLQQCHKLNWKCDTVSKFCSNVLCSFIYSILPLVLSVGELLTLSVCVQNISKSYEWIPMIFSRKNANVLQTNCSAFGLDLESFKGNGSFSRILSDRAYTDILQCISET